MGLTDRTATAIYGLYTATAYLAALPGGWIADRFLGAQSAVWYGGIIMALGGLIVMWPRATRGGARRRAEGGYVVVMQSSERRPAHVPEPPVEAGV